MASKKKDRQAQALLSAAYEFVADYFPRNNFSFENLRRDVFQGDSLAQLRAIVRKRLKSTTPEYKLQKDYSTPNVEEASWNTLNVLCHLHNKLRLFKQTIGLEALRYLLEDSIAEVGTPVWLSQRIITHLPPMVLQAFGDQGLIERIDETDKPYVVYCGKNLPNDCDAADLLKYRKLAREGHFDIFIDDIPPQKHILIRGEPGKFTPGKGLPYKILRHLLIRVGREVSYAELRRSVWTLQQSQMMSGLSKVLHDKLDGIRTQLRISSTVSEDEPDKWFKKTSVRGVVYVWEELNSCLITVPRRLRPYLK